MKTELNLLGEHFNMAPRKNRRWLVGILYGIFAALMAHAWWRSGTAFEATFIAFFFGGFARYIVGGDYHGKYFLFGSRGLVDPFYGNEILKRRERKDRSQISRLLLDPPIDDVRNVRNDERSLRSRDYAHFIAFGELSSLLGLAMFLAFDNSLGLPIRFGIGLTPTAVHQIILGIVQVCYVMSLTLPQCVQLWTEPDMDSEQGRIS